MDRSNKIRLRPGGRSQEIGNRVAQAVRGLLEPGGYAAINYQAVAEIAAVSRATLYRRWPTRADLALFGIAQVTREEISIADSGQLATDLTETLVSVANFLSTKLGRATLIAALEIETEGRLKASLWQARAEEIRSMFIRAAARGEIDPQTDWEAVFSMASGSLYFRIIATDQPTDRPWIERIVAHCLPGI